MTSSEITNVELIKKRQTKKVHSQWERRMVAIFKRSSIVEFCNPA